MIATMFRFMLHPFFKWVYKQDFESYEAKATMFAEGNILKNKEIEMLKIELGKYQYGGETMRQLMHEYKYNILSLTPNGETVVISYSHLNILSSVIVLSHLRTKNGIKCCKMSTCTEENGHVLSLLNSAGIQLGNTTLMTTITDIGCSLECRRHGYATTLLSFVFQEARQQNLKYLGGWLSYVDKMHHEDLKRLYERLNYEVYLFPDKEEGVIIKRLDDEEIL
jgi:hypothetical protein|nr:MAG TPA: acetyltransferase domain containing protein [Caudoviricetes sp.]